MGAFLLARELGAGVAGATVAGVAFAYAPWRLSQSGHLHVLSSGGIPLALFLLLRGYRTGRAPVVLAGWLVATWQLSLGFSLGLPFAYVLAVLVLVGLVGWARGAWSFDRRVVRASLLGASVFLVAGALLARPYFRVVDEFPEARRTTDEVVFFSPAWRSYAVAPEENLIWGDATGSLRDSLRFPVEQSLFPGALILALALLGLAARSYPVRLRLGLGVAAAAVALLAMGFQQGGLSQYLPYRLLYELAPGWQGVRTPSRLTTLTTLALALLAAGGAQAVAGFAVRSRRRWAAAATSAVLAAGVFAEGYGVPELPRVPEPPEALDGLSAPQLHLPFDLRHDQTYMYWSADGFPAIVNGLSGFEPLSIRRLREVTRRFPDERSVAALRALGVRTVVLHPGLAAGTPWREAEGRPVAGLPVLRREGEGVVAYSIAR